MLICRIFRHFQLPSYQWYFEERAWFWRHTVPHRFSYNTIPLYIIMLALPWAPLSIMTWLNFMHIYYDGCVLLIYRWGFDGAYDYGWGCQIERRGVPRCQPCHTSLRLRRYFITFSKLWDMAPCRSSMSRMPTADCRCEAFRGSSRASIGVPFRCLWDDIWHIAIMGLWCRVSIH